MALRDKCDGEPPAKQSPRQAGDCFGQKKLALALTDRYFPALLKTSGSSFAASST